jgi:hypothetical protein
MNNKFISHILLSFLYLTNLSAQKVPCQERFERTLVKLGAKKLSEMST